MRVRVITNPVDHTSASHFSEVYEPPVRHHDKKYYICAATVTDYFTCDKVVDIPKSSHI